MERWHRWRTYSSCKKNHQNQIFHEISGSYNQPQDHCDGRYNRAWWHDKKLKWSTTYLAIMADTWVIQIRIRNNRQNNHKSKEIDNTLIPRFGGACFFRFLLYINKIATDGGGGAVVAEVKFPYRDMVFWTPTYELRKPSKNWDCTNSFLWHSQPLLSGDNS